MQKQNIIGEVEEYINHISHTCLDEGWKSDNELDIYGGKMGLAVFFASMSAHDFNNKTACEAQTYKLTSDVLNNINLLSDMDSLSGIAGITWALQYMVDLSFFEYEQVKDYLVKLKNSIIAHIDFNHNNKNYDLMHGLIGQLLTLKKIYLSNRTAHPEILQLLQDSVQYFINTSIKTPCQTKIYWTSPFGGQYVITGMAHGVSSIIWYLSGLIEDNIFEDLENELITELITKASNWLINEAYQKDDSGLKVPTKVRQQGSYKKNYLLGWCHGDLGVAIALIKAGNILKNDSILNEGVNIAENAAIIKVTESTIHQDQENTDSTVCHGTYGVFLIFYLLYRRTENQKLKNAYEYWLSIILQSFDSTKKCCNLAYAYHDENTNLKWNHSVGILNGLSGNGLVLLTYYLCESNTHINHNWFDIFL